MDKWALITGASKRIGLAIAKSLHQSGFNIIIHYGHSTQAALHLCSQLNKIRSHSAQTLQADLGDEHELESLVKNIKDQSIKLEVLVNNASVFYPTPMGKANFSECQKILSTNLIAPYLLAQELSALLKSNHGCIINLLDIHGKRPLKDHALYSISKAALEMATLSLAQELAPEVRVNGVAPGAILWPEGSSEQAQDAVLNTVPLGKLGDAQDIAQLVCYLVEAPYVSGQVIAVDGGRSATGFIGA